MFDHPSIYLFPLFAAGFVLQSIRLARALEQLALISKERNAQFEAIKHKQEIVQAGVGQLSDIRVHQTDVKSRSEGSAAALGAVFSVLGIKRPLLISIPSLRETPIPDRCDDLSPYLDEQANARLIFLRTLLHTHFNGAPFGEPSLSTNLKTLEEELTQGGTQPHIEMPQSPRDREATQELLEQENARLRKPS